MKLAVDLLVELVPGGVVPGEGALEELCDVARGLSRPGAVRGHLPIVPGGRRYGKPSTMES
jgi:hypothetical protein